MSVLPRVLHDAGAAPFSPAAAGTLEHDLFSDPAYALCSWPNKQTQWWYVTGTLKTLRFGDLGFQLVFFERRTALDRFGLLPTRWFQPERQIIAHFALSGLEADGAHFRSAERGGFFGGGAQGTAAMDHLHVTAGGWALEQLPDGTLQLAASDRDISLKLALAPRKPLVLHGEGGWLRKTTEPARASFYCSYTNLSVSGELSVGGQTENVGGSAWFDHEKMTVDKHLFINGWCWYSLQLDDGQDLMVYAFRDRHGVTAPGAWTLVDKRGATVHGRDAGLEALEHWVSPRTKARYPVKQRLTIPSQRVDLTCEPSWRVQEVDADRTIFTAYWEGRVTASGSAAGRAVTGAGYLECAGFDRRFKTRLLQWLVSP